MNWNPENPRESVGSSRRAVQKAQKNTAETRQRKTTSVLGTLGWSPAFPGCQISGRQKSRLLLLYLLAPLTPDSFRCGFAALGPL